MPVERSESTDTIIQSPSPLRRVDTAEPLLGADKRSVATQTATQPPPCPAPAPGDSSQGPLLIAMLAMMALLVGLHLGGRR